MPTRMRSAAGDQAVARRAPFRVVQQLGRGTVADTGEESGRLSRPEVREQVDGAPNAREGGSELPVHLFVSSEKKKKMAAGRLLAGVQSAA